MSLTLGVLSRSIRFETIVPQIWHAAVARLDRMARGAALRREMDRMDQHIMSDLGISRAQLHFEVDEWEHGRRHDRA